MIIRVQVTDEVVVEIPCDYVGYDGDSDTSLKCSNALAGDARDVIAYFKTYLYWRDITPKTPQPASTDSESPSIEDMFRPEQTPLSTATLINQARKSISDSSWVVGACAHKMLTKFNGVMSEAGVAELFGVTLDALCCRRRVYETFGSERDKYSNLLFGHFIAALNWSDAGASLEWANDHQANVPEMRAWRRAQRGDGE